MNTVKTSNASLIYGQRGCILFHAVKTIESRLVCEKSNSLSGVLKAPTNEMDLAKSSLV
jgi:hypothetical protein